MEGVGAGGGGGGGGGGGASLIVTSPPCMHVQATLQWLNNNVSP